MFLYKFSTLSIYTNSGLIEWKKSNEFYLVKFLQTISILYWLITDICSTGEEPLQVNSLRPSDAYMRQQTNHHWVR